METSEEQLVRIVKLFYEDKLSKTDIAKIENIPRSQVAQLLQEAEKRGIVSIRINEDHQKERFLQYWMELYFSLKICHVTANENPEDRFAEMLAEELNSQNVKGFRLGVDSLKISRRAIKKYLERTSDCRMEIIAITGQEESDAREPIIHARGKGKGVLWLPYSMEVHSEEDREIYYKSSIMKNIRDKWEKLDAALVSVRDCRKFESANASLQDNLYIMKWLLQNPDQAVGCFLGRSINIYGEFLNIERNRRIIGIAPGTLKKIKNVTAVAPGKDSLYGIIGMMNTGLVSGLYIDETTAELLMQMISIQGSKHFQKINMELEGTGKCRIKNRETVLNIRK